MPGQCCGKSSRSEPDKVAMATAPQVTEAVEQPVANSQKSECCCKDKPAKSEKRGCGC